jgi:hypothetical protein
MGTAEALEGISAVFAASGQPELAVRLASAAAAIRLRIGTQPLPFLRGTFEQYLNKARAQLTDVQWLAAWQAGSPMTIEGAVALALA